MSHESARPQSPRRWRRALAVACGVAAVPGAVAAAYAATGNGSAPSHHETSVAAAGNDTQPTEFESEHGTTAPAPTGEEPSATVADGHDAVSPQDGPTPSPSVRSEAPETEPRDNNGVEAPEPPEAQEPEAEPPENEPGDQPGPGDGSTAPTGTMTQTFTSAGGSLTVTETNGVLSLDSTSPAAGFSVEVHDNGPDRVEVRFHNGDVEWRIRVEFVNGAFTSEISQDG